MKLLAIDTSNHVLGVAIMEEGQIIGELVTNMKKNHSLRLMPAIENLMKEVDVSPEELEAVAVAQGPGSYTGVRIGLTTAKTLAWTLNIPVTGVSSLEVLAYRGSYFDGYVCPFFDARRGLVYAGLYKWKDNQLHAVYKDENLLMADLLDKISSEDKNIIFLSPDISTFEDEITRRLGGQAIIPAAPFHIAKPSDLGLASYRHEASPVHEITPRYLRLSEAESNWLKQQKENEKND